MNTRLFAALLAGLLFLAGAPAPGATDPKGTVFLLILDRTTTPQEASALQGELDRLSTADATGPKFTVVNADDLSAATSAADDLGGVIELSSKQEASQSARCVLEVYHYPFPSITPKHISSPEYSFKFGSGSALLAIHLRKSLATDSADVEIRPATAANPLLPAETLRKTVRLTTQDSLNAIAGQIFQAAAAFRRDEACYVMGLLSEKAQRHARPENVEIRVFKYTYPDKEPPGRTQTRRSEEEQPADPITVVKPFATGLYCIEGLADLTPYSFTVSDTSKDPKDPWHKLDQGSFVTSSVKGIVRTVPGKFDGYTPLSASQSQPAPDAPPDPKLDCVITGATVFDGSKNRPRFTADVGIAGEKIAAVGDLKNRPRAVTVDGAGLFLMPGYIDIHSHADDNILTVACAPSHTRQGITTVLGGNCSFSPLGIGAFCADMESKGAVVNLGVLIGNRPVREKVLGRRKGSPSYDEVYRQKELVDLAMEEGAFGLSSGLIYAVSEEAFTWELAELARQVQPYGGFYASHIRGETDEVLDAAREAMYIGQLAQVPVQISHMKVINKRNWGGMDAYLDLLRDARARGLDVTGDQYPWRASGPAADNSLHTLLTREAIGAETPEVVLLKDMPGKYAKYSGRPLTDLLAGENTTPEQLVKDLNLTKDSPLRATYLCLGDEDVCRPMREDFVMVCTDAGLFSREGIESGKARNEHPRKFRTYPEFFARYVRDRKVCSWELGVYKCTGLPAERMKLTDRGRIRPGAFADLVLLSPDELDPGADYRDQTPPPKGIRYVFLNGLAVLKDGQLTPDRAGKPLRAYGHMKP